MNRLFVLRSGIYMFRQRGTIFPSDHNSSPNYFYFMQNLSLHLSALALDFAIFITIFGFKKKKNFASTITMLRLFKFPCSLRIIFFSKTSRLTVSSILRSQAARYASSFVSFWLWKLSAPAYTVTSTISDIFIFGQKSILDSMLWLVTNFALWLHMIPTCVRLH